MGGAIFVMQGANLTIAGTLTVNGGTVTGGAGAAATAKPSAPACSCKAAAPSPSNPVPGRTS